MLSGKLGSVTITEPLLSHSTLHLPSRAPTFALHFLLCWCKELFYKKHAAPMVGVKACLGLHELLRNSGCDTNAARGSWEHLQHAMVYSKPTVQWHAGLWGKLCVLLARGISGGLRVCLRFGSSQTADVPSEGEACSKWPYLLEVNQDKAVGQPSMFTAAGMLLCWCSIFHPRSQNVWKNVNKRKLAPVFAGLSEPDDCYLLWLLTAREPTPILGLLWLRDRVLP